MQENACWRLQAGKRAAHFHLTEGHFLNDCIKVPFQNLKVQKSTSLSAAAVKEVQVRPWSLTLYDLAKLKHLANILGTIMFILQW